MNGLADGVMRLLIVDDHPVSRHGLRQLLSRETDILVVGEAADGQQAVDQVRRTVPHVVLMDIRMPVLDGIAATRKICAECPHVVVLGMSMGPEDQRGPEMLHAGAVECIDKGDWHAITAAIRRWIKRQEPA